MDLELERVQSVKKRKKIMRILFGALLGIVFLAMLLLVLDKWYFRVRKITVSPSSLYTEEELIAACRLEKGSRLFGVDTKEVKRGIEERFAFLKNVEVRISLPDTVKVSFQEKMGEIALTLGRETFAVDSDLTVLARIDKNDAASRLGLTAEGVSKCIVGKKIEFFDTSVPGILSDLVQALDNEGMLGSVRSLDLRDKFNLRMDYMGRFEVLLGENTDLDLKLKMLKQVMKDYSPDDTGEADVSDPNDVYVLPYNRAA